MVAFLAQLIEWGANLRGVVMTNISTGIPLYVILYWIAELVLLVCLCVMIGRATWLLLGARKNRSSRLDRLRNVKWLLLLTNRLGVLAFLVGIATNLYGLISVVPQFASASSDFDAGLLALVITESMSLSFVGALLLVLALASVFVLDYIREFLSRVSSDQVSDQH